MFYKILYLKLARVWAAIGNGEGKTKILIIIIY